LYTLLLFFVAIGTIEYADVSSVRFGTDDNAMAIELGGGSRLYSYFVHPRDWQDTGIPVKKGDKITVQAEGSVNVSIGRLVTAANVKKGPKPEGNLVSAELTDYNKTSEQVREKSLSIYPWFGPGGMKEATIRTESMRERIRNRHAQRLFLDFKFGQLVMAIAEPGNIKINGNPQRWEGEAYPMEEWQTTVTAETDGNLHFIVNDVYDGREDSYTNQVYWLDNIGFFSAKIKVD